MKQQLTISSEHPVMRDHHVLGRPVLSGLAYIDMLYQLFRKHGYDYRVLELRDITIYRPLTTAPEKDVQIEIRIEEAQDGRWQVVVEESGKENDTPAAPRMRYMTAEMHRMTAMTSFNERVELATIKAVAKDSCDVNEVYAARRKDGLVHGPFMKVSGEVYDTDSAIYVHCGLTPDASSSAERAMFHPALLDGSAVCGGGMLAKRRQSNAESLAIPLYYKSFKAASLLNSELLARIPLASARRTSDLSYFTLEFFDRKGTKIAELVDLVGKTIRDAQSFGEPPRNGVDSQAEPSSQRRPDVQIGNDSANRGDKQPPTLEILLREIVARYVHVSVDTVDSTFSFYDLGIDSGDLLRMVDEIGAAIETSLPPTLLFEYTTIAELAAHLRESYVKTGVAAAFSARAQAAPAASRAEQRARVSRMRSEDDAAACSEEDIAIIGLEGRYPGANALDTFWENLAAGKDCIVEVPKHRWSLQDFYEPDPERAIREGKSYSKWGGFFTNVPDSEPRDPATSANGSEPVGFELATFRELVGSLFERAAHTTAYRDKVLENRVGMYMGAMADGLAGAKASELVNSISSLFGLQGPSVAIDTMSSSALAAVHMACDALRRGDCRVAVASAVYILRSSNFIYLSGHKILGSHPGSRSFAVSDGLLLSEGMGAVLLKKLSHAVMDNDDVLGVIKSSSMNHAGNPARGFVALQDLISDTLAKAKVEPRAISYVESGASGQPVADALEIGALTKVFSERKVARSSCVIGSVKSNIGHAAAASGMSQLTKVLLQLRHHRLVPSIKIDPINADLRLDDGPFRLQRELAEWHRPSLDEGGRGKWPRRALINSLGGGGSYVSILVEEYERTAFTEC